MKLLKRIAFCLLGILLFVLTIATILEKVNGTEFVNNHIYSSVPFIILWGSTALASLLYMIKRKLHRQWTTFLLHLSFILIIGGSICHMDRWRTRNLTTETWRENNVLP